MQLWSSRHSLEGSSGRTAGRGSSSAALDGNSDVSRTGFSGGVSWESVNADSTLASAAKGTPATLDSVETATDVTASPSEPVTVASEDPASALKEIAPGVASRSLICTAVSPMKATVPHKAAIVTNWRGVIIHPPRGSPDGGAASRQCNLDCRITLR